jgi:general secretion pathway protein D
METGGQSHRASNRYMLSLSPLRAVVLATISCCLSAHSKAQVAPAVESPPLIDSTKGAPAPEASKAAHSRPSTRQFRQAEAAYREGAKKLGQDELDGAEQDFIYALQLDPGNQNYAVAISVAREHRVSELVARSSTARLAGDPDKAQSLLEAARQMDPQNPIVLEHIQREMVPGATVPAPTAEGFSPASRTGSISFAGPIELQPTAGLKNFDLRGPGGDLLRQVASQFAIRTVLDPSVDARTIRFSVQNVTYERAMYALMTITHTFAVPIDEHTVLFAHDDQANRDRLEPLVQETIDVPGATTQKLQDLANVIRNVFNVKNAIVDVAAGRIVVRAPQAVFEPLNRTLEPLLDSGGEVMLEIKLYEVANSRTVKAGVQLPNQFTAFNVNQAANKIVSDNQALVQQAIAQGLVSSTATNLQIALALIGSGLVQSDLATNLIGVFGGGLLQTGVASSTSGATLNLARNSSDTRMLDDVQLRVNDREEATFRAGTRYPILTSSYSTGLSTPASALSNTTINGVNVANLLAQFSGGTTATIPQVTYEDLGLTLTAKPAFQSAGHISLQLDLVIQAVSGSGLNGIPVLLNRHFTTSLSVSDGESALLVSDVSKTETAAMAGIPGLSELPGLHAPTERDTVKDSGELVVIVTPHIVRRRADTAAGPRMALHLAPTR